MKKFLTWFVVITMIVVGVYAGVTMGKLPRTYESQDAAVSAYELQQDPYSYDDTKADGAAAAIVQQNLATAQAVNDVTSIVFDFRGYDTMGEAFILITAVAGSIVILFNKKEKKVEEEGKQDE